jgi:hypothetical protein
MAIIVVGGSGRNVGKTALVCALIRGLPEFQWTAVKVSSHDHGKDQPVWEETMAGQATDTARYLAAGAHRAFLVTAAGGVLPLQDFQKKAGPGANLIFESNSLLTLLKPDLCLGVLGESGGDVKPSFLSFMRQADAFAVRLDSALDPQWAESPKPLFRFAAELEPLSPQMLAWVRAKLLPEPHS